MTESVVERSAGGVVVRWSGGRPHVLLIRDPYRKWGLPKGHVEGDEGAVSAARREVREETGINEVNVSEELGTIDWWFHLEGRRIHKYCTFFLMTTEQETVAPEVDEGITECVWLPIDEAVDTISYDNARQMVEKARTLVRDGAEEDS